MEGTLWMPDPIARAFVMLGVGVLLSLLLLWGWGRQLPWPNVLAVAAGTVFFVCLVFFIASLMESGTPPALRDWAHLLPQVFPLLLSSRLLAQELWKWRVGRPYFGYELMALTAVLALLPIGLFSPDLNFWPGLVTAFVLVVVWQIALTPWWIRKSPAPPPRDWTGPLAWVIWVGMHYWVSALVRQHHALFLVLCLLPGLWALARWPRLSAARPPPGPA